MAKFEEIFEEIGRRVDLELEHLRQVAETEISPGARRKAAHALRRASEALERFAKDLEAGVSPKQE